MIERLKGYIGQRINGMAVNIDIVNGCTLACPSCAVGSIGRRRHHLMTIETFRDILDKLQAQTKIRRVQLYIYSDPGMHPDLHLFVEECTRRGLPSWLSTMCQTTLCDWWKVIEARPTELRISFPGWRHMGYYQKNATVERFTENFARMMLLPRHPETTWTLCYHLYRDNKDEVQKAKALARNEGMKLVILPAIFMPMEKYVERRYSEQDKELIGRLLETPEQATSRMRFDDTYCPLWKQLALDARGEVYLCQLIYEERFRIGHYTAPLHELRRKMRSHPFCGKCMQAGGHAYQSCYADFTLPGDPVERANRKRKYTLPD